MENSSTRKTFVFNTVWYEIIKDCSAQVKGEVFAAVMEYALYGKMPRDICNEANVIFQFIKIEIDRREKRRLRPSAPQKPLNSLETLGSLESLETLESLEPLPEARQLTRQQRRKLERDSRKLRMAS